MKISEQTKYIVEEVENNVWTTLYKAYSHTDAKRIAKNYTINNQIPTRLVKCVIYTELLDEYNPTG